MSATAARDLAITLARADTKAAYEKARRIADPWFRCQALAWVAWHSDDARFDGFAADAMTAALEAGESYHCVGASAWPVRAMIERGRSARVAATVAKMMPFATRIEHPVRRGDALFLLWQAAYPLKATRKDLLPELVAACHAMDSWKGARILRDVALTLAHDDPAAARTVIGAMAEGRLKWQAARRVGAGEFITPREFFW